MFVGKGGQPVSVVAVRDRVIRLAKKVGVRLTMKALRRAFGRRYAGKVLQKLMRHSDIKITMNYYANVDDAVMEAVLGAQRNTSRNSRPESSGRPDTASTQTVTDKGISK